MGKRVESIVPSMARTTMLFTLILFMFCLASAQKISSNITRGSSLTPKNISAWLSPSGLYAFGFFRKGNGYHLGIYIAEIPEMTVVWVANRDNPPVNSSSTLLLTTDGKLIVRPLEGDDTAIIETSDPIYSASMLDSGNLVLYNSAQEVIWQSFDNPTDTILPGQSLKTEKKLYSSASKDDYSTGLFCLRMQIDGNLVQYPAEHPDVFDYAYWVSNTYVGSEGNYSLNLDNTGNLYILNSTANIKNLTQEISPKEDSILMMRIDVDGIFRIYSHKLDQKGNWSIEWESSEDKCAPKGLCGVNSFCVLNDMDADCKCLPGFDFVSPGIWSSGCERNYTVERCKNKNESEKMEYDMAVLDNTTWDYVSYSELSLKTKGDCIKACLNDCNCEATSYKDGKCRKQRLPLRYGRRSITDTNIDFIKVGSPKPFSNAEKSGKPARTHILIIGLVLVSLSFAIFAISGIFIYKTRLWGYRKISEQRTVDLGEDVSLRAFTFAELEHVTKGFSEELGRGAFGTVYKGVIPHNEKAVAVKRLERALTEEGEREFQAEIKVIGRTHHRNLVRLIGYCLEGSNRLLVYDYMSNGTLANFIVRPENRPSWEERIAIALDIARGIFYLHEECDTQIIHCDIKPQNILMDQKMHAKISDFGLAKLLKPDETKTYTGIRGTRGYVAPEWHRKMPVTVKVDVYSFGIVLFEIICCRRSVDLTLPEEEAVLEEWVYQCFEANQLKQLVRGEEVGMKKLERVVKVGLWCIQDEPSLRPSMKKVVLMLEGTVEIPVPPSPTSFLSTI